MGEMNEAYTEDGPHLVPKGEAALVTSHGMRGLVLLIPNFDDKNAPVDPMVIFLTACLVRFHTDEDFVKDQLDWFEAQKQ